MGELEKGRACRREGGGQPFFNNLREEKTVFTKRAQLIWMARAIVALWLCVPAGHAQAGVNNATIQVAPGGTATQLINGATSVLANAIVSGDAQLLTVTSWTPVAHGSLVLNADGTF